MKLSKKFLVAIALVGSTSLVHAEVKLVPSDDSELSKLCVAAATADSTKSVYTLVESAGIARLEVPTLRCNGLPITRFAAKYGERAAPSLATTMSPLGFILSKTDTSPLTELCAAAAISDAEFAKVKDSHFSNDPSIEAELHCNGLPLKSFVRKFRSAPGALVSAR